MLNKILVVALLLSISLATRSFTPVEKKAPIMLAATPDTGKGPFAYPDFQKMFVPDTPLLEIIIRGSITYLAIFFLLRLVLKREAGSLAMSDLLVVVLLADAAQNSMAGEYHSITDGILLVAVIILWSHFLDFLGYYFPFIQRLVHPAPLPLVRNGEVLRANLRKELITMEELKSLLREQGVSSLAEVKEAYMETNGHISVISKNKK
ncbi:DUF421 domain-containing protein [Chitinophaga japonensis]|uniref:Uncharacterized protein DUF421 n=1 Tax=Chitinophaga japonensis TaxID=104662 RepID=A0A562SZK0_CHIJA|nr:YetF domain-containing protein [Chitinophaga japonensis]TWI86725.1 uncharacterized protein DUF421 [Chitinophaga japonensis]